MALYTYYHDVIDFSQMQILYNACRKLTVFTRSVKPDLSSLQLPYSWAILCCGLEGCSDIGFFFLGITENDADSTFSYILIYMCRLFSQQITSTY